MRAGQVWKGEVSGIPVRVAFTRHFIDRFESDEAGRPAAGRTLDPHDVWEVILDAIPDITQTWKEQWDHSGVITSRGLGLNMSFVTETDHEGLSIVMKNLMIKPSHYAAFPGDHVFAVAGPSMGAAEQMIKTATWKEHQWERQDDGTWVDAATGQVDPLAEDMTISNFYNFRVIKYGHQRQYVEVPYAAAHEDPELEFVLAFKKAAPAEEGDEWKGYSEEDQEELLRRHRIPGNQRDHHGRRVILVPIAAWDYWNDKIGSIGMWHPEIR